MKLFSVLSVLVLGGLAMGSSDVNGATPAAPAADKSKTAPAAKGTEDVAVIKTSLGTIVFRFNEKDAPLHVANFK